LVCKHAGLDRLDMEEMTVGMCLDYVDDYIEMNDPKRNKSKVRKAGQSDFDSF
jgi:hypothetical protein